MTFNRLSFFLGAIAGIRGSLGRRTRGCLLVCLAGACFHGCGSLDVENPNAPSMADVTLQSLVSGIEGGMRTDMFIYLVASGTLAREVYNFDGAEPRWVEALFTGPLDPDFFIVVAPWSSRYRVIRNTIALQERAQGELAGAELSALNGFAKTVIAYQLLLNLNYVGDNGIKTAFSRDINTPFVSQAQAYAEIERYLDEGHSDLLAGGDAFPFSLSSGFAGFDAPSTFAQVNRALRARVAIYQSDYSAALTALSDSFIGGGLSEGAYHVYTTGPGDQVNPLFEEPTSSAVKLRAHPMIGQRAEPNDTRYTSKVLDRSGDPSFNPAPGAGDGLSSALVVTVASSSVAPIPMIRNEELLLIRAEANIGLGDFSAAESDINDVRRAAGLSEVVLTDDNALDQLIHERMYSLFLEGQRLVDVRRFGLLDELPNDRPGDQVFGQFPRPLDELPGQ